MSRLSTKQRRARARNRRWPLRTTRVFHSVTLVERWVIPALTSPCTFGDVCRAVFAAEHRVEVLD